MSRPTVAILASGEGTTAEAFIRAGAEGKITAQVKLIICNNADAGIFARTDKLNKELGLSVVCKLVNGKTHPAAKDELVMPGRQTKAEEAAIIALLEEGNFDAICLMGYMKMVGPRLVSRFGWRPEYTSPYQASMVNTHPGLLPATTGLYGRLVQESVLENGAPFSGQTLHVVAEKYDEGPVLAEHTVAVKPGDTVEDLLARVQACEKEFLPDDVEEFILKRRQYLEGAVA